MTIIKDKYGIFVGFLNHKLKMFLINKLYIEGRIINLIDFHLQTLTDKQCEKIKENYEKQLNITLDYIYPLLKEGKLKVRIRKFELDKKIDNTKYYKIIESNEYKKEDADFVISEIKNRWKSLRTVKERMDFSMFDVQFTLPENEWPKNN